ncbi:MAG: ribonuclease HIII [Bacilli bacterium]|nr:ribonuclease HIII [Bacilli bacterium]
MKGQTIVFKISDNLKDEVIDFYKDRTIENNPPYSVFQVRDYDCTITLYESGKLMFQGIGADIEASYWTEQERILNKRDVNKELKDKEKKKEEKENKEDHTNYNVYDTMGSDEVGTGDYFGPIVVTASFVDKKSQMLLNNLGVRDSKKLTDEKIISIAPEVIQNVPHVTFTFTPKDYNKFGITNMNKIKAILHNKALYQLKQKNLPYQKIVVDQFCPPDKYYEHINNVPAKVTNITFTTHAEDKCLSVAASSIISRYIFLKEMKKLNQELDELVPLGAGDGVDKFGCKIVQKYGINKLNDIAKLNFKNTDKIKESLNIK